MGPNPTGLESLKQHRHTQGRPCEDTGRRQPSTRRGERPQEEPALPTPGPRIPASRTGDRECLLFKAPTVRHSLWQPRLTNNVAQNMLGISDRAEQVGQSRGKSTSPWKGVKSNKR